MDRRSFFKIISSVSAGAASIACNQEKSDDLIPLLVPDHEIVPGEEQWHPSICSSCDAGCGVVVRVMRGERVIEKNGQRVREPIACIKKLEGNPLDSVSGGRLCARGHAALQSIYNPDRLRGPMHRVGTRGKAEFAAISWDEAIVSVSEKLAKVHASNPSRILFLTSPQPGTRSLAIQHFLEALGAPPAASCSLGDLRLERKAAELVFGWRGLPRYDLANARYALGVGADFLGGWASPVYYARQYGHFRQGRPGLRGKFVQAESRMSLTSANADEWLPLRPGSEPQLLIALARLLLEDKLTRHSEADAVSEAILAANLPELIGATGLPEKHLRRIARELGESEAPLVISGASLIQTNSLDALIAAQYVNVLLGNIGRAGGVLPPNSSTISTHPEENIPEALKQAQFLVLDGQNPAYTYPTSSAVIGALSSIETIVSFGNFIDDSAAFADFLLPDHHAMESESAVRPTVSGTSMAFAVTIPFTRPLYNTMPIQQTLAGIAQKLKTEFTAISAQSMIEPALEEGETWNAVALQGGLWRDDNSPAPNFKPLNPKLTWSQAGFSGNADQFPLHFQPYLSLQYHDGRSANLPWMQELPDPTSSSMWSLPVEVDPKTAAKLKVTTGDWLRVESPEGTIEAQAYIHPAALPGVVSMAIGEGHANYGRYASSRGLNPISILSPVFDPSTNALVFGATRVRITRLEGRSGELTQFSHKTGNKDPGATDERYQSTATSLGHGHRYRPLHGLPSLCRRLPRRK